MEVSREQSRQDKTQLKEEVEELRGLLDARDGEIKVSYDDGDDNDAYVDDDFDEDYDDVDDDNDDDDDDEEVEELQFLLDARDGEIKVFNNDDYDDDVDDDDNDVDDDDDDDGDDDDEVEEL